MDSHVSIVVPPVRSEVESELDGGPTSELDGDATSELASLFATPPPEQPTVKRSTRT
jgi:hypothetical protein